MGSRALVMGSRSLILLAIALSWALPCTVVCSTHAPQPYHATWENTLKWFPQVKQCGLGWMQEYSQLHAQIANGSKPSRWLVSVSAEAGVADRLSGLITLFWTAVVTKRAISEVAYSPVPSFANACAYPWINWTHPHVLPAEVVDPVKYTYKGERGYGGDRSYDKGVVDTNKYYPLYLTTHLKPQERDQVKLEHYDIFFRTNLTNLPASNPSVPYIIAGANKGRSFRMASNPYHRQQFWKFGITPENAFMCGFFFLCSPNAAVQQMYQQTWEQLSAPGVLSIGIQIRLGDHVMRGGGFFQKVDKAAADRFFECAQQIERTHALPGQKVVWFLNSDSHQLRRAAKRKYGSKLLTDYSKAVHVDCLYNRPKTCKGKAMAVAMQRAVGAMLTFSMTEFQVISHDSGFGRLPAWMSGRWNNIYDMESNCAVTPRAASADHFAGVR